MGTAINKRLLTGTSIAKNAFILNERLPQKIFGNRECWEVEAFAIRDPQWDLFPVSPDSCPLAAMDATEWTGRYRGVGKTSLCVKKSFLILFKFNTHLIWGKSSNLSGPESVLFSMGLTSILYSWHFGRMGIAFLTQCLAQKCSKIEDIIATVAYVAADDVVL